MRRFFYVTIPLSVILIKYFPGIGRTYSSWTGAALYNGVATGKNILGLLCVLSAIFFFWDTLGRWKARTERRTMRTLFVNLAFLAMTLWLLRLASSAMSFLCLIVGCFLILATSGRWARRHHRPVKILIPAGIALYLVLEIGFGLTEVVIQALGRDSTLTGRTELWSALLAADINPILGAGYEAFWLGDRLQQLWTWFPWRPNQAHNGYLEMYVNLGLLGVGLLIAILISSYRTASSRLTTAHTFGSLGLALWTTFVMYNVTEGAVSNGVAWFTLLLAGTHVPATALGRQLATSRHSPSRIGEVPRIS
jgi:O-antigen ligase